MPALASAFLACTSPPPASSGLAAPPVRSDAADRESLELTVYASSFALVRERRRLHLQPGRVALDFEDVAAALVPATVQLQPLDPSAALSILEQNYRQDLLTPDSLLARYVGRRVSLVRADEHAGRDQVRAAEVLAGPNGPVLRVGGAGGEIVTGLGERIVFPELPAGLAARPTLSWLLESAAADPRVEVSYLTHDLGWQADYVLQLAADGAHGDLHGWATLDNLSGATFRGAKLSLVAGEHLYGFARPVDVLDHERKQFGLFEAAALPLERRLLLRGAELGERGANAEPSLEHPQVLLRLENRAALGLGLPLPKGTVRVYQSQASGAQEFLAETPIEHTPRDETLELALGTSFDVVAQRRQMRWQSLGPCAAESEWRIELRNHGSLAVNVEVREPLSGDFEVDAATLPLTARDAHGFSFLVPVPAGGSNTLGYRLRARWCSAG